MIGRADTGTLGFRTVMRSAWPKINGLRVK
jgi:hypothetical protein